MTKGGVRDFGCAGEQERRHTRVSWRRARCRLRAHRERATAARGGRLLTRARAPRASQVTGIANKAAFDLALLEAGDKLVVVDFTAEWWWVE